MALEALMIGVSGTRGTIGGTLTPEVVTRMAAALAVTIKKQSPPTGRNHYRVIVGRDSRPSGPFVRDAAVSALVASGLEVIDLDIVTTPGVAMMVKHLDADAGIIITASHNPIEWNGLKYLNRQAVAPPTAVAADIRTIFEAGIADYVRVQHVLPVQKNGETHALHVKKVLDHVDVNGISGRRFKVVLDSVNGAGCVSASTLLSRLGCQLVHLHGSPNGQFPHMPEPTEANLQELAGEVRRQRAHVGFAQDPDADRLAIIDENGRYIGEEYSLVLTARWLLSKKPGGLAVTNLSTSRMLDDVAAAHGGRVLRTPVGEANVVETIIAEGAAVGGEGNGGVIDPRIVGGRDSLVGIAYVLQLMAATGKTVSQLVAEIPTYVIVKTKFDCRREDAELAVAALKREYADQKIDIQDGIRIDWPDAWVHARASNTEPIMRIIAEAKTEEAARARAADVQRTVDKALGK